MSQATKLGTILIIPTVAMSLGGAAFVIEPLLAVGTDQVMNMKSKIPS